MCSVQYVAEHLEFFLTELEFHERHPSASPGELITVATGDAS